MREDIKIELLSANDTPGVAQAAKLLDDMSQCHTDNMPEVFDEHRIPKTPEYVENLLKDDKIQIWVAKDGDAVVGVLQGAIKTSEPNPGWRERSYGYLDALFVIDSHRKEGVARALMQAAQSFFKQQGLTVVEANVWGFNAASRRLTDSLGYEVKNTNLWLHI